jgi:hypothetical protein
MGLNGGWPKKMGEKRSMENKINGACTGGMHPT